MARGFLGVAVSELTPDLIQGFGMKEGTKGALVQSVQPKSPAAKAGLQPGDVVVGVNGKPVETSAQLTRTVSSVLPGGKLTLSVLRGNEKKDLQATVAQRPDEEALARGETNPDDGEGGDGKGTGSKGSEEKLGVRVAPLTAELARELRVSSDQGVVVVGVTPDGPAASAGIRRNDVILEVNRQAVTKVDQIAGMIGKLKPGQVAVLRVLRGEQAMYLPVKLGGAPKDKSGEGKK